MPQQTRPPIVTIMGHVDHGKTTLLDAIRKSRLAAAEVGGITQHIGAYQIEHQGKKITFIDTPGHAAFSKMRQRGATVTDIVVLVIAGTEGVKPQTVESIKHILASKCHLIIAANKKDLPGFSADMIKAQLTEYQIFCEGYGGQTPFVEISALKGEGINELLDMILLLAEVEDIKADPAASLEAVIIESRLDRHRGAIASAVVKQGTLHPGDQIYLNQEPIKVRGLFNDVGKKTSAVLPGDPVEIIGFKFVPPVGATLTSGPVAAPTRSEEPQVAESTPDAAANQPRYNLIIKADTEGALEAIRASISPDITIIDGSVGSVIESDVLLADSTQAEIISFNVPITPPAQRLAEIENITISSFKIIYKLLEYLEEKMLKLMEPTIDEIILGEAEIIATFEIKGNRIAGCKVKSGEIAKNHRLHLLRDNQIIADPKIQSLKRGKEDIPLAKAGTECGIVFTAYIDFRVGDVIKSYKKS